VAKLIEFEQGILCAVGLVCKIADQPVIAANILREVGLTNADCSSLDDYGKLNLMAVSQERGINLINLK
jgi:hypothetical protein